MIDRAARGPVALSEAYLVARSRPVRQTSKRALRRGGFGLWFGMRGKTKGPGHEPRRPEIS